MAIIMPTQWQLQEAKNKLSHLIKMAVAGEAQIVTVHGKPTAVVISAEAYAKLTHTATGKLSEALLAPEIGLQEPVFERDPDTGRDIAL